MHKAKVSSVLLFCLCSVLMGLSQAWGQDQGCAVKITSPIAEAMVPEMDQVQGTGSIPAGTYLWIFDHRKGLALWWPQGGGPAEITKGSWEVTASFGLKRDNGHQFEIVALVVDREANDKLKNWVNQAEKTGEYPGINLPLPINACKLQQVTVTKIS